MKKYLAVLAILIVSGCSAKKIQSQLDLVYPKPVTAVADATLPPQPQASMERIPAPALPDQQQTNISDMPSPGAGQAPDAVVTPIKPQVDQKLPDQTQLGKNMPKPAGLKYDKPSITVASAPVSISAKITISQPTQFQKTVKLILILLFACILLFIIIVISNHYWDAKRNR